MDAPKRSRGRPPLDIEVKESLWLTVRISPERRDAYTVAAAKSGTKLAAWVKGTLDRAAARALKR